MDLDLDPDLAPRKRKRRSEYEGAPMRNPGPANGLAHELPRNQLKSRSEATSKDDLRGQLHALVGPPLGITSATLAPRTHQPFDGTGVSAAAAD